MPVTALASLTTPTDNQSLHRSSHILELVAGPWAEQLSILFEFPFLQLTERSSIWWHIAAISLSSPIASPNNVKVIFEHIPCWKEAAWMACPSFTSDNVSILKKMPLPLWQGRSYRHLSRILHCERAVKIMRHADQVTPDLIAKIHDLPVQFRFKRITDWLVVPAQARLISKLFSHRSNDELVTLSRSLNNAPNRKSFWNKIRERFVEQTDQLAIPPAVTDPRVEPVVTFKRLRELSNEFNNCLSDLYRLDCMSGEHAIYVFHSDQEKVVICVSPRIGSVPVITEIKGKNNSDPSTSTVKDIREVFSAHGFRFEDEEPAHLYCRLDHDLNYFAAHDDPAGIERRVEKAMERVKRLSPVTNG